VSDMVKVEFEFNTRLLEEYAEEKFKSVLFSRPMSKRTSFMFSDEPPVTEKEKALRATIDDRVLGVVLDLDIEGVVKDIVSSIFRKEVIEIVSQTIRQEVKKKVKELKLSGELFSGVE